MSQEMIEIKHILELPEEVLGMIFDYLPKQQFRLGQVCKRFYNISCLITKCNVKINLQNGLKDDMLASILNSRRRITELEIKSSNSLKEVEKIFKNFGDGIKEVRLNFVSVTSKDLSFLNYAYNLHRLQLTNVTLKRKTPKTFRLNLTKLKILSIESCHEKLLSAFSSLPNDVLTELYLTFNEIEANEKYFQNQKKIKILHGDAYFLDYTGLVDLVSLEISSSDFGVPGKPLINTEKLNVICEKLEKLEELEIHVEEFVEIDFSAVQKLKNLKKFKVSFDENHINVTSFRTIGSKTIEEICVSSENLTNVENIKFGCPNIRKIQLEGLETKTSIVNNILLNFPKVESLSVHSEDFLHPTEIIDGFEHENLKELSITSDSSIEGVIFNIVACSSLQKLTLSLEATNQSLINFIANQPSLKLLFIDCSSDFDETVMEDLERVTRNLDGIVFTFSDSYGQIYFDFHENFPVVDVRRDIVDDEHDSRQIIFRKNKSVNVFKKFC